MNCLKAFSLSKACPCSLLYANEVCKIITLELSSLHPDGYRIKNSSKRKIKTRIRVQQFSSAPVDDTHDGEKIFSEDRESVEGSSITELAEKNAMNLEEYSEEEVLEARKVLSSLIMSGDDIENKLTEYSKEGKINNVLLSVIQNRLELAKQDNALDAIKCFDLLFRRIKVELESMSASPSMRLLNQLLNLKGSRNRNKKSWLREAKDIMLSTFVPEHAMVIPSFVMDEEEFQKEEEMFLRMDFIVEVDELLDQVMSKLPDPESLVGTDVSTVTLKLQVMEKMKLLEDVKALRDLAIILKW